MTSDDVCDFAEGFVKGDGRGLLISAVRPPGLLSVPVWSPPPTLLALSKRPWLWRLPCPKLTDAMDARFNDVFSEFRALSPYFEVGIGHWPSPFCVRLAGNPNESDV